jgi:curved DNA-binding protein CbpA
MATGPLDDHYTILGIDVETDDAKLRRVWRRLALRWHPDRAGPAGTAMFQRIRPVRFRMRVPSAR